MKYILMIILCISCAASFAQQEIKVDDAKSHVGENVKICTKIYGGKFFERDTLTLLNAGASYPDAPLTVVIHGETRRDFNNEPEEYYKDAEVCITGTVELFKEKPEIVVTSKDQIVEQLKDYISKEPN
ncbi:MAG: hypothetical protein M3139_08730 [Bacteroidota bacterium]|nr:hypothetical protein [Bacteroidota bacterium]